MEEFYKWKIVPDTIDKAPASVAEVVWSNGAKAGMGNMLTPTQGICPLPPPRTLMAMNPFGRSRREEVKPPWIRSRRYVGSCKDGPDALHEDIGSFILFNNCLSASRLNVPDWQFLSRDVGKVEEGSKGGVRVKDEPKVSFPFEEGALYTIIMTEPDAPKHIAEVHHWMKINVKEGNSETGQTHSEYIGSGPPEGTGIHRYVFLVFKQPPKFTPTEAYRPRNKAKRHAWSARRFAKDNNLGNPVAGNFYRAYYDTYTTKLHGELNAATPK
ncbi:Protein D1 [Holothuria leucospilota]|uniref:Protein D1 n=1 Tax=Holothuria leucospilota TaxID=206669 RepID=A0A9Q1BI50_HOLLE|nr:Protein D1 [Holothuria leucospilota]